ncbi:protein kinase family protein [Erwinia piriflorinigrans]|uniref:OspG n=1 Tax=Erwinia piriflorinigrans CFBP 5888 TaxID=1161919 RepID=V5Z8L6_9GAMM|nr:protein kinase family protein [Erwinia piriflorinigrans]CCG87298.1 OspG [Erwinia piriflorinigrans CFBP 5888]
MPQAVAQYSTAIGNDVNISVSQPVARISLPLVSLHNTCVSPAINTGRADNLSDEKRMPPNDNSLPREIVDWTSNREAGLGGRKRKAAVSVLEEQDGFTKESARQLLADYKFPDNSFYSDYMFALDVEQTGKIPPWAGRFKKWPRLDDGSEEILQTVRVAKPDFPQHKLKLNLGGVLSKGGYGEVYLDADDKDYLIKKIPIENFTVPVGKYFIETTPIESALHEAEMFNRYYGERAAMVFVDKNNNAYIRMYRVPGKTLGSLSPGSLPDDAKQRYVDMIEKLNNIGIIHDDLHSENILWDVSSRLFYPIDISDGRDRYFSSDTERKDEINELDENDWYRILAQIEGRKQ